MNDIIKPAVCVCGHLSNEHRGGENCEACGCTGFTLAQPAAQLIYTCTQCGIQSQYEICESCAKAVAENYPGDLFNYLFGVRDCVGPKVGRELLPKIKTKILAMEIHNAGLDVKTLWDFWKSKHV